MGYMAQAYELYKQYGKTVEKQQVSLPTSDFLSSLINDTVIKPLSSLYDNFITALSQVGKDLREGKITTLITTFSGSIALSISMTLALDLLQTSVLGNAINLRKTLDKIDRLFNPELVVTAISETLVNIGIAQNVKLYANTIFTPNIPDPRTLSIGYFKNYYGYSQLRKYLKMHGIPDEFHNLVIDLNDFTPSIPHIERILRYYPVSKEVLEDWLRENGVRQDELDFWFNYLEYVIVRDEFNTYLSTLKDLYVNGYMSEEELDAELKTIKQHPREREVMFKMLKLLKFKNLMKMYIDKHIYLYRKGVLSEQQLHEALAKLYKDPEIAQAVVQLEASKKGVLYP